MQGDPVATAFEPTPDPAVYVPRTATERALKRLEDWLGLGGTLALLHGPSGLGKTLLLHVLESRLPADLRCCHLELPRPGVDMPALAAAALSALGEPDGDASGEGAPGEAPRDPVAALATVAGRCAERGDGLLLLLDDATSLPIETAEAIRTLIETANGSLRVVLAADSELARPEMREALGPQLESVPLDEAMTWRETTHYVRARLERVGLLDNYSERLGRLTLARLSRRAAGVPALVNVLAMGLLADFNAAPPPPDSAQAPNSERSDSRAPSAAGPAPRSLEGVELPHAPGVRIEPRRAASAVRSTRSVSATASSLSATLRRPRADDVPDLILVAGGRLWANETRPARDLYTSVLFRKGRWHAEHSGRPWYVLSSRHGLVEPDRVIEPDTRTLSELAPAAREEWSAGVARDLLEPIARTGARRVEVLAGSAYLEFGLIEALERLGVEVHAPHRGLPVPDQLGWLDRERSRRLGRRARAAQPSELPTAEHALALATDFAEGRIPVGGRPSGWEALPEARACRRLRAAGASPRQVRVFLTHICVVESEPNTPPEPIWSRGVRLWREERWAFSFDALRDRPLADLAAALERHGLSDSPFAAAGRWRALAEALEPAHCPAALESALAGEPVAALDVRRALETERPDRSYRVPRLHEPGVAVRWLRRMTWPGEAAIKDLDAMPIVVDEAIERASRLVGLSAGSSPRSAASEVLARAWRDAARLAGSFGAPPGLDGAAIGLEPALTAFGNAGCCQGETGGEPGARCRLCRQAPHRTSGDRSRV